MRQLLFSFLNIMSMDTVASKKRKEIYQLQ